MKKIAFDDRAWKRPDDTLNAPWWNMLKHHIVRGDSIYLIYNESPEAAEDLISFFHPDLMDEINLVKSGTDIEYDIGYCWGSGDIPSAVFEVAYEKVS